MNPPTWRYLSAVRNEYQVPADCGRGAEGSTDRVLLRALDARRPRHAAEGPVARGHRGSLRRHGLLLGRRADLLAAARCRQPRPSATRAATRRTRPTRRRAAVAPGTPRRCSSRTTPLSPHRSCCSRPSGRTTTRRRASARATTGAPSTARRSTGRRTPSALPSRRPRQRSRPSSPSTGSVPSRPRCGRPPRLGSSGTPRLPPAVTVQEPRRLLQPRARSGLTCQVGRAPVQLTRRGVTARAGRPSAHGHFGSAAATSGGPPPTPGAKRPSGT
jgi:hypothetical protein